MAQPSKRVAVLFHIADFNDGGIESSLMQWLRIYDRARFTVTLSVMFSSPAFERRFRAMESLAAARGVAFAQLDLAAQEDLWQAVKRAE